METRAKHRFTVDKILDANLNRLAWFPDAPSIFRVHAHEWGNMKRLGMPINAVTAARLTITIPEDIGMPFQPRRVLDLGDDRLDRDSVGVETVIQSERTEGVAETTQLGQDPHRTTRSDARFSLHNISNVVVHGLQGIAQVVGTPKRSKAESMCRNQTSPHQPRQFREVEVSQRKAIVKTMPHRGQALVVQNAFVETAFH